MIYIKSDLGKIISEFTKWFGFWLINVVLKIIIDRVKLKSGKIVNNERSTQKSSDQKRQSIAITINLLSLSFYFCKNTYMYIKLGLTENHKQENLDQRFDTLDCPVCLCFFGKRNVVNKEINDQR